MRKHVLRCIVLLLASPVFATIAPVQSQHNWSGSGTSCAVTFTSFPANNDLIVVWTSWAVTSGPNSITASVTDSLHNGDPTTHLFPSAVGPTIQSASSTASQIFYAKSITGGSTDMVTVTFSSAPSSSNCVIAEASGADLTNPLDSVSAGYSTVGNPTTLLDSGTVAPANANLLLFGGGTSDTGTASLGTGFSLVQKNGGSITEYEVLSGNTALQRATATAGSGNWVMQMAVFRDASWTVAGGWGPGRPGNVLYVDQFPGNDIGAQANNACANLPTGGGTLIFPPGIFQFSNTITNCNKNVVFRGAGAGTPTFPSAPNQLVGTDLQYTGSGEVIVLSGNAVQAWVRDLAIDNTGTGTVAIDFGGSSNCCLNHSGMENVTINSQTCFSKAAVLIGNDENVVDTIIKDSYIRCDNATSSTPMLLTSRVNEVVNVDNTHFTGGGVMLGTWSQMTMSGYLTTAFHMTGGALEPNNNVDAVQVIYAASVVFDHVSAEVGTTGYALDCPSTAEECLGMKWVDGAVFGNGSTVYAFHLDLGTADLVVQNTYFNSFANPAHVIDAQNASRGFLQGNTLFSTGMDLTNTGAGGPICMVNNYNAQNATFYNDFSCTPVTTFAGRVVAPPANGLCLGNSSLCWTAGSGAPSSSCETGSLYSNTTGSPSALYACTATNTWTAVTIP